MWYPNVNLIQKSNYGWFPNSKIENSTLRQFLVINSYQDLKQKLSLVVDITSSSVFFFLFCIVLYSFALLLTTVH